jgi:ribosomal protein L7/L12
MPTLKINIEEVKEFFANKHCVRPEEVHITGLSTISATLNDFYAACENKHKLKAIKHLKDLTGASLMASKQFMDSLFDES